MRHSNCFRPDLTLHALLSLLLLLFMFAQAEAAFARPMIAPDAPLNEELLSVPVSTAPPVHLVVTIYMPSGAGPYPLAVINHGSYFDPPRAPRISDNFAAYYFLSRGYAVAMPMLRGYAGSEGHWVPHGCDIIATGLDAARDIRTTIDYLKQVPGIDPSRIVVAGKSIGGWNTLVFGTLDVRDIKGLISFAGAMKESDCKTPDATLISSAAQLGAHTKIRSIWFFGDNDQIFATPTWRGMFQQYTAAGGPAELVAFGTFLNDAHAIFASGEGLRSWVPKLDQFLAKIGMPNEEVHPEYLPSHPPPVTHFADINDLSAVPYLDQAHLALYRGFLAAPLPRAIAVGLGGAGVAAGGFDSAVAAMDQCWRQATYCQLYAIDSDVVWPRQASAPAPTHFAALADAGKVPYMNERGRMAYKLFLTLRRPRAFAVSQDGGYGAASGTDPITGALASCSQGHPGCQLYAVDGDIVWPERR
jgi:dienelactone hydrolase